MATGKADSSDTFERICTKLQVARAPLPEATYRLQFHAGFTFQEAARITAYLRDLGITHCYASPYLKAQPGSTHGYDIVDHDKLNPEVGSGADYDAWCEALSENGLGQILDVVPNHMGVATNDNAWWNDVLENGPASQFGRYFDIAWHSSRRKEMQDKVLLPVLGQPYGDALESGELRLCHEDGVFTIRYFERRLPVAVHSYGVILEHRLEQLTTSLATDAPGVLEYQSILTAVRNLPDRGTTEPQKIAERAREKEIIKRRLAALTAEDEVIRAFVAENVRQFNGANDLADRFALLDGLLEQQCYRLSYWRVAPDEINYRRFFDINELAALSMERPDVFDAAHHKVMELLAQGKVSGLRIDHPDGLFDPLQYLWRLQAAYLLAGAREFFRSQDEFKDADWSEVEPRLRERIHETLRDHGNVPLYVVVEKILSSGESLPENWPVHGTSGYDFLNMVNGLFVESKNAELFRRRYEELIDDDTRYFDLTYQKKLLVLNVSLASELHMLTHQLDRLAQKNRKSRDFTFNTLRRALREVIACFPVYRSYIADGVVHDADRRSIEMAIRRATVRNPLLGRRVFRFIRDMLLLEYPDSFTEEERAEQRLFAGKFQQVTGPVTAKGVEDTAFYVYNRLMSVNEVGGEPDRFGVSPSALHKYCAARQERWPHALSPLSTHDTKRSEDVRARLNVLSEIPDEYWAAVQRWRELNAPLRRTVDEVIAPDANEECLLYQTLLGAWPIEPFDAGERASLVARVQAYMTKALHEAKVHTSWINPNEEYDAAVSAFVADIMDVERSKAFLEDFAALRRRVAHFGFFNSLAQTLLKITLPGAPDTYQGTEIWDFSLVDPDNRRPVDYEKRAAMLAALQTEAAKVQDLQRFARGLIDSKEDGRVKLYVNYRALSCRRDHPRLFSGGDYVPLESEGDASEHVFAFLRHDGNRWALVAAPRLVATLIPHGNQPPLGAAVWSDTRLKLPETVRGLHWRNVFTGESVDGVSVGQMFENFPVALLIAEAGGDPPTIHMQHHE